MNTVRSTFLSQHWFLIVIILFASFFVLGDSEDSYLWRDEAHVALIAENILKVGYPLAKDDNNVFYESSKDINKDWVWTIHPWLQNYIVAASFLLLGVSAFTARLPFALFGLASVVLLYFFLERFFNDKLLTRIVLMLQVTSVPLLLYMRQGFYPVLVVFFTLAVVYATVALQYEKKDGKSWLWLTISLVLLFHSMYNAYVAVVLALIFYSVVYSVCEQQFRFLKKITFSVLLSLVFIVPWMIYADVFSRSVRLTSASFFTNFVKYLLYVNNYFFPYALFGIVAGIVLMHTVMMRKKVRCASLFSLNFRSWFLRHSVSIILFIFTLSIIVTNSFISGSYGRYIVGCIPLLFIFLGRVIRPLFKYHVLLGVVIMSVLVLTNVVHQSPYLFTGTFEVRSYLADFVYELTHPYTDAVEGISQHLLKYGTENDTFVTYCAPLSVIFYTHMRFANYSTLPDWFVPRPGLDVIASGYTVQELPVPYSYLDSPTSGECENDPDIARHQFRTMTHRQNVTIYKLVVPAENASLVIKNEYGFMKLG